MFMPNDMLTDLQDRAKRLLDRMFSHRALYAGLALCHGSGCVITDKPALYGPMAVLYAILCLRG